MSVTGRDGNVIHADFGKPSLTITLSTQILYCDESVALVRVKSEISGRAGKTEHFMLEVGEG